MNRIAARLAVVSAAGLLFAGLGATSASAATLPSGDDLYALSCPQEDNPYVPQAMQLWSIDAATVAGATIGGGSGDVEGTCAGQPAWNPVTKSAYAFALTDEHDEPSVLMRVDVTTGASTPVAAMYYEDEPVQVASLAIGLDGAAYALAYTRLYSVDLTTGALTAIGDGIPLSYGFAVDPTTGRFWALTSGSTLMEIDVATGGFTLGQSLELAGAYSMQIDSAGGLWVFTANVDEDPIIRTELWAAAFGVTEPSTSVGVLSIVDEGEPLSQALLLVPTPSGAADARALAATGHDPLQAITAGALLVLVGVALAAARRPRGVS